MTPGQDNQFSLLQIASRLREDINEFLPENIDASVNTSQSLEGNLVTVTVTRWPREIPMLSRTFIFNERRAILTGLKSEMSKHHELSDEAKLLTAQLQNLVNHYQVVNGENRNFIGEVAFDKRSLDNERTRVLQALKESGSSKRQTSLFPTK